MSKKNSNVNLRKGFKDFKDLSEVYQNFKKKLDTLNKKKYLIAVSGGPDSLALVALSKAYTHDKKTKFFYVLVDHNIRKNSLNEAKSVKRLLKKYQISLHVLKNKKMITKNIQSEARTVRYNLLINFCKKKKD